MNSKINLLLTLTIATYILTSCNNSPTTIDDKKDTTASQTTTMKNDSMSKMDNKMNNGLMGAMNTMMDKMNSMKMTGDFDLDFTNMMIEHHKGAIDMSEEEAKAGSDNKIKGMAQKIINSQKEEIGKFQDIIKNHKTSDMKMGQGELEKSMSDMMSKMKSMQMSGDMDKDFATMMVPHHQSAVSMFEKEIAFGTDAKLKQMAKKGIDEQTKEINEFKAWLDTKK